MGFRRQKFNKRRNPYARKLKDHEYNYRRKVVEAKRFEPRDIKLSDVRKETDYE